MPFQPQFVQPGAERMRVEYPLALRHTDAALGSGRFLNRTRVRKQAIRKQPSASANKASASYDVVLERMVPLAAILWALVVWGYSIVDIDPRAMSDMGLVSVLPLSAYLAVVLLTFSFSWTLHLGRAPTWLLWLHIAAFIFMIHGAPTLIYDTLRYSWAWKHLGIIDFIQRVGYVDPNVSVLSAYHNWPGFFSFFAFLFDVAEIRNPILFAAWTPVLINLLNTGALVLIYKASTNDRRLIWQAVWFFFLANWVGQDYFSPQALNYFLHLVIIGICLVWFRNEFQPETQRGAGRKFLQPITNLLNRLQQKAALSDAQELNAPPLQRTGVLVIVIVLYTVIVTSHQLTPIMTIAALVALVVLRRCRANTLPLAMIVIALTWIVFGATFFVRGEIGYLVESFGAFTSNIERNLINLGDASFGQQVVAIAGRVLTVGVLLLAIGGCILRIYRGQWDLSLMALAFAPFLVLATNGYGGEIVFRVYLFAMPFLAVFVAALLYPSIDTGNSSWVIGANIVLSLLLFAGFNLAYYGKDSVYYFSKDEVAASEYLASSAPPNTLLIEGSRNYPSQFRNYEYFTYVPIARERPEDQREILQDPAGVLQRWMENSQYNAAYFIVTRSQKAEVNTLPGTLPVGSLETIERELLASPAFTVIYENRDARIFALRSQESGEES